MGTKEFIRLAIVVLITAGMVGAAQATGEREIIFPEIAAILTGLILAPRLPWRTTKTRLVVTLSLCACLGYGIATWVPVPLSLQVTLAFLLGQSTLMLSGTTLAPMISAAVLPVLLQSRSIVYPCAAMVLALVCAGIRLVCERTGLAAPVLVRPHPGVWGGMRLLILRSSLVSALATGAILCGLPLVVAPPLLVAYTQLTRHTNPLRRVPGRLILGVTACAGTGTLTRLALQPACGATVAAAIAAGLVAWGMMRTRFLFPPAAAMAILAFLIPEGQLALYPLEAALGIGILTYASRLTS